MSKENLESIRHSLAHILAYAIKETYPGVKFGIGPAIENGFYYDFDFSTTTAATFKQEDLPKIEKKMRDLLKKNLTFASKVISKDEAKKIFADQPYKLALIDRVGGNEVSIYQSGKFVDLCKGPHIASTKEIDAKAFSLERVAGAYWEGDEKNKMLTRVYGFAFETATALKNFIDLRAEAEKRNHIKLGKELELFMISKEVGQGLILWLPKGAMLKRITEQFAINTYLKNGYQLVCTPHLAKEDLFKISGHLEFYKDSIFAPFESEGEKYYVKPMNCPMHLVIYKNSQKSYRDLPLRYAELGTVYRYEKSGELRGLTRVRGFTQDDGHILCTPDQLQGEINKVLDLFHYVLSSFGYEKFKLSLSVRDPKNKEKYLGNDADWEKAEAALLKGIEHIGWKYERQEGEAAFYGPKIDLKVNDAIGREWQLSTLQVDFNEPIRFDIHYIDKAGQKKRPIMLHRALLGSIERFLGVLIENYGGNFPVWLAPVQAAIVPVSDKHLGYAQKIYEMLFDNGIRVELESGDGTMGNKIRKVELQKIPYVVVVGDKEIAENLISIRQRGEKALSRQKPENFIELILKQNK